MGGSNMNISVLVFSVYQDQTGNKELIPRPLTQPCTFVMTGSTNLLMELSKKVSLSCLPNNLLSCFLRLEWAPYMTMLTKALFVFFHFPRLKEIPIRQMKRNVRIL